MKFDEMCWNYGGYSHYSHINAQNILKKGDDTEQLLLILNRQQTPTKFAALFSESKRKMHFSLLFTSTIIMGATRLNGFINC